MKDKSGLLEIPVDVADNTMTSKNFSFSQWLINSQKLRVYTARSNKSLGASLKKLSKLNQAAEW